MTEIRFRTSAVNNPLIAGPRSIRVVVSSDIAPGRSVELGAMYMTPEEYEAFAVRLFPTSPRPGSALDPTLQDPMPAFDPDRDPITPLEDLEPRHGQAAH